MDQELTRERFELDKCLIPFMINIIHGGEYFKCLHALTYNTKVLHYNMSTWSISTMCSAIIAESSTSFGAYSLV
jgi:hypothetical protein